MVVIFLIILLLFGAKKLPQLARGLGKSMGEFKKAKDEFEHEITRAEDEVTHDNAQKTQSAPQSQARELEDSASASKTEQPIDKEAEKQS